MPSGRRRPHPDRILVARLSGSAVRLARAGGPIDEAVAELRALANGRGDLLAETAGVIAGAWTARVDTGDHLLAAGLLVLAGADHDQIARWVDVGRERAAAPRHSIEADRIGPGRWRCELSDDARDAFDEFDRRWAERQGVFERRTIHRELELVVMPGHDDRALDVARRRAVPESVRPKIREVRDHPRGPHAVWRWEWNEVEFVPVEESGG